MGQEHQEIDDDGAHVGADASEERAAAQRNAEFRGGVRRAGPRRDGRYADLQPRGHRSAFPEAARIQVGTPDSEARCSLLLLLFSSLSLLLRSLLLLLLWLLLLLLLLLSLLLWSGAELPYIAVWVG